MRFFAADSANIGVDHLFLRNSQRLKEVHKEVEGLLDIEGTAFKQEGLAFELEVDESEGIVGLYFCDFVRVSLEVLECFGV